MKTRPFCADLYSIVQRYIVCYAQNRGHSLKQFFEEFFLLTLLPNQIYDLKYVQ